MWGMTKKDYKQNVAACMCCLQVEKQTRLNDIHVLAFLHPHQLKCLEAKKLPATLDNELVINEEDVDRLRVS